MPWTNKKTASAIGAGLLLLTGIAIAVKEAQTPRRYPWQGHEGVITDKDLNQPPQIKIVPSRFHTPGIYTGDTLLGKGLPLQTVIANAYGYTTTARAVFSVQLPTKHYDYIACLPGGEDVNEKALQAAIRNKFGVAARTETRDADVMLLTVKRLKTIDSEHHRGASNGNGCWPIPGGFRFWNDGMENVAATLEFGANMPVIDATGLTNSYDFDLNCTEGQIKNRDWTQVNAALARVGLELVATNMPIEMLVVEKAN